MWKTLAAILSNLAKDIVLPLLAMASIWFLVAFVMCEMLHDLSDDISFRFPLCIKI